MKPLLLTCKCVNENNVLSEGGYGSFPKDLCYIENE